jgi:NTP pyrophosphatase (non-canonical NTP hydrolase)
MTEGIKEIADYYGLDDQLDQLVEECAELIKEVQKYKRAKKRRDEGAALLAKLRILDERVDVEVMLQQIRYLNNDNVEMNLHIDEKIKRQLTRIEREKANVPF